MTCLPQPLFRLPRGDWHCPDCSAHMPSNATKRALAAREAGITSQSFDPLPDLNLHPSDTSIFSANPPVELRPPPPPHLSLTATDPSPPQGTDPASNTAAGSTSNSSTPASKRGRVIRQPVRYNPIFLSMALLHNIFSSTTTSTTPPAPPAPQDLKEALESPEAADWTEATISEVTSLIEKGTFQVVPKGNQSTVKTKWVFKRKVDAFGNFLKYKARLVAKGFLQKFGVDYFDVFSPVTKLSTLRVLLALVAALDLELRHVDVCTAFLNGDLTEEVYIDVPEGLHDLYPDRCFKLNKAIYGLKQAPRVWWLNLSSTLSRHGFKPTFSDQCLFTKMGKKGTVFCLVYVDDILFAGDSEDVDEAVEIILNNYEATDEGDAKSFLGMGIVRDRLKRTLKLTQKAYVTDLANKFSFDANHKNQKASIPITSPVEFPTSTTLDPVKAGSYASLVGSLLYLANCTRPDISSAVSTLARYFSAPTDFTFKMAKQLLRYCINTQELGLTFGPGTLSNPVNVIGFSDSDYGNSRFSLDDQPVNRRSVSGFAFLINGTPVCWQSKKQAVMARSTDDAEYIGLATAASSGLWLRKLLGEMNGKFEPILIYGDNAAALKHIESPGSINKSKHIDIAYQFVLDRALRNDLKFAYVPSAENAADIFTKALGAVIFLKIRDLLGVSP